MEVKNEESDTEDRKQTSPSISDNENRVDSANSRHSNVSFIINEKKPDEIREQIYEDDIDVSNEEESGDESLFVIKERQKTFDRINRTMERNMAKWKKLNEDVMLKNVDDDSFLTLIDGRIDEIKSMCCSLIRPEYILDSQISEIKDYAFSLATVSRQSFENNYRVGWKKIDLFRYAGRMAMTYAALAQNHLKYPWWEDSKRRVILELSNQGLKITKYSINKVLRLSLTTHPKYRSKASIQQVLWFNRAIGAFTDLFPIEMENDLARYISYEIYDDNRVIRYQGDVPQKLYYILSGKIEMVKVYRLSQGEVHKSIGFLTHKQMSDFESFAEGSCSPTYLVARNRLEVLSLHKEDYEGLSKQTNVDSIRGFVHQIRIFKDMPITSEALTSQLLKMHYYKKEKVITSDSLRETYLYIVKSGIVSVARKQRVLDKSIGTLLSSTDAYSLGCKRDGKHASAMQGLPKRQRNCKEMQWDKSRSMDVMECKNPTIKIKAHTMIGKLRDCETPSVNIPAVRSRTLFDINSPIDLIGTSDHRKVTEILSGVSQKSNPERETYVKLDALKPLDIFGLDSIEDMSGGSQSKLVLISEGAEVLMVNKRYFLESVNNNTLLEIRKLIKSYISEEEAKMIIDDDTKWRAYKQVLMERMISLHC